MSKELPPTSKLAAEEALLAGIDDILEKSAAVSDEEAVRTAAAFTADDPDRFEARPASPDEPEEAEEDAEEDKINSGEWSAQPSVRRQMAKHPTTVRMAEPTTKVFDLRKEQDLAAYNLIQRGAGDVEAPTHAITEVDKTTIPGSWIVTFYRMQYLKL